LSNKNENATVPKFEIFSELNKPLVSKNFQDSPSHGIYIHMHGALNIDENKN
jgi:hypothetical protein